MRLSRVAMVSLVTLFLAACENVAINKESVGALLGAVAGGVTGSQVGKGRGQLVATAAGALLGSYIGKEIGKSLDKADRLAMEQTMNQSLEISPVGKTTAWQNPDSGNSGTVTPKKTFKRKEGGYCREFLTTVTVGGRSEEAYGTACRQPDGSWKIVSS